MVKWVTISQSYTLSFCFPDYEGSGATRLPIHQTPNFISVTKISQSLSKGYF